MSTATLTDAALNAPTHPALRWTTPVSDGRQHRRARDGRATLCGIPGPLALAESSDPRCESGCWG